MTRDEVIKELYWIKTGTVLNPEAYDALEIAISALTDQKWIPCSKTTDIPDHEIMACDKYGEIIFGYLECDQGEWVCESDECVMYSPIAWREKPEPYREEGANDG